MTLALDRLEALFHGAEIGVSADNHPYVRVPTADVRSTIQRSRDELGFQLFVDLTATDDPAREDRFELNYLLYSIPEHAWLRIKARTAEAAASVVDVYPGANWYEREVFDLFGVRFEGHPNLRRIVLPDNWDGHPLRRDEPLRREPVDFTVTRELYGT